MDALAAWLGEFDLGQYLAVFTANDIDLATLSLLSDADLKELGLSLGHRRKLLNALSQAQPAMAPSALEDAPTEVAQPAGTTQVAGEHGERRQLTVLFCDMVGFTELSQRVDPEVLQQIVRAYEDACAVAITRYDGYVYQRLGDGIVAFFGYPLAHEGEAERAIHAGLSILEALNRLQLPAVDRLAVRIGIATGLVVVRSAQMGAVGEAMNLAARLQTIAEPDTIVVSEQVRRLAAGAFDYEDLGEHALKGVARPLRAFRVKAVSEATSRFEAATRSGLTPMVGRHHELAMLMERWGLAQEGEGQVVLLSGEPGIGKSRTLGGLLERLEAQGAVALRLQCSPYHVNSAYHPIIDNLERTLRFRPDESNDAKLDRLEHLLVDQYQLPRADVPFVAGMLSLPCDNRFEVVALPPHKQKDETIRVVVDIAEAAARQRPTVMLYEDVHWADPTSLDVMDQLVQRIGRVPLLVVLTHRPEFRSRWQAHGHVLALNLSKLTRAQSSAMVAELTGGRSLPDELLERILARTDGVPLFVEELTRAVLESGDLQVQGNQYTSVGSIHDVVIPVTLRDSLMARLDRYAPVKEIAQIGAAIGRTFSHELIAAVASMDLGQLDRALAQLVESGLAFRKGTPPDATYTFKHALVQDAAYDSLLRSRRQELHGKIARVIEARHPRTRDSEPEVLAHHWQSAGDVPRAVDYWLLAGQQAAYRCAGGEAESHLHAGIQLARAQGNDADMRRREISLQLALGRVLMFDRGWASADLEQAYLRARSLCEGSNASDELFSAMWGLWTYYLMSGALGKASAIAAEMLALARRRNNPLWQGGGHYANGVTNCWLGNWAAAGEHLTLCAFRSEHYGHADKVALYGLDIGGVAAGLADFANWLAGDLSARMRSIARAHLVQPDYVHPYSRIWGPLAEALGYACRLEAELTQENATRALELADRFGFAQERAFATMLVAWADNERSPDDNGATLAAFLTAADAWRATGAKVCTTWMASLLVSMYLKCGQLENAERELESVITWMELEAEHAFEAELFRLQGELIQRRGGAPADAEASYRRAMQVAHRQGARTLELRAALRLADLWKLQGRTIEAHGMLEDLCASFDPGASSPELDGARRMLAAWGC